MSWAIFSMVQKLGAVAGHGRGRAAAGASRAAWSPSWRPTTRCSRPRWPSARCRSGTLDTAAPEPMSTFTRSGLFTPFTPVFNASGQPGISLPLYEGEDGLPLAVQLVGRPAGEGALLALAAQLEEAPVGGAAGPGAWPGAARASCAATSPARAISRRPSTAAHRACGVTPSARCRRLPRARPSAPPSARPRPTSRTRARPAPPPAGAACARRSASARARAGAGGCSERARADDLGVA